MSVVIRAVEEHRASVALQSDDDASLRPVMQADRNGFLSEFRARIDQSVRPLLAFYVADLVALQHDALIDEDLADPYAPFVTVRFLPVVGMKLPDLRARESVFTVRAVAATRQVEYVAVYDQLSGENGATCVALGIQSMSEARIERLFEECSRSALRAWRP